MTINKSIIESFELSSGHTVYVQSNGIGDYIALSFDGNSTGYSITITKEETKEYIEKLKKVLEEIG